MGFDLNRLLDIRLYQALDADSEGRVLGGSDDTGSTQLIEIAQDGTITPLTALPGACTGRYIPGQRTVIVSHDQGGNERHQLSLLHIERLSGGPAGLADLEPLVHDPAYIHSLADVTATRICYLTNRRNGVAFDPVVRDLGSGEERQLVLGEMQFESAALSPDGRWLALTVPSKVTANAEHVALADLSAAEGGLTMVTPPDAPAMNMALNWTPGSDALIFTSGNDREFTALARYDMARRDLTWLVTDERGDLTGWLSPDGARLLVERNDDGASVLTVHDASTGELLRDLPLPGTGAGTITSLRLPAPRWTPDSRTIVASVSSPEYPSDALRLYPDSGKPTRLLTTSSAIVAEGGYLPVLPELHRVPAGDGELIPCRVYRGGGESAVLVVHGGPESQARQSFDPVVQGLAAAGHTVLVPNVRGSTGYGKRWYQADDGRKRFASVADLAALHAYLPELGLDQKRAALWGGSYGGYMVLAGLAFQPELWAAGVDIVGIASFVTFLENTSAYRRVYREREYGTLAEDRDFLASISPITRVDDIAAPLLLIHGANDPRVPLSEAQQIHAALTSREAECELIVYADEGHGLAKRANRADAIPKAFAFLARHLDTEPL